jgi:4-hydroxybenzoate polyprenyltransferase
MTTLRTYLTLFRVSNLPTVWSNVTGAVLLSALPFSWTALASLLVSLSLLYTGGMAFNDLCDAAVDRLQRPERPLPSGRISAAEVRLVTALLFACALALLATLPHGARAAGAGVVLAGVIVLYDLHHKGNPLSVLLMAGCRFLVYVVAGFGIAGEVTGAVLVLGLIQFGYIALVSVVARLENRREGGYPFPLVPLMLAGICLIDGIALSVALGAACWLVLGIGGMLATILGQKYVRGD